jgi:hypothetical protein
MVDGIVLMKNFTDRVVYIEQFRNYQTKLQSTMGVNDQILIMFQGSDVLRVEYDQEVATFSLMRSETRGVYFDSDESPSFSLHVVDMNATSLSGSLSGKKVFVTYLLANHICA